jgi:hypothetical protein
MFHTFSVYIFKDVLLAGICSGEKVEKLRHLFAAFAKKAAPLFIQDVKEQIEFIYWKPFDTAGDQP